MRGRRPGRHRRPRPRGWVAGVTTVPRGEVTLPGPATRRRTRRRLGPGTGNGPGPGAGNPA
ncbi:MAG: hypothetical protein AVDCRST_MAG49-219 [uncultured Thermomicrobiales bacterium]|uniref:Uncharacterized protein n=1 Tax=uncultured Thermomicrobiales bacterium TaxID=1645740 RepID=A0A6J4U1P5_9BACT|nr:MAG: hypothetical protein AVDCRST_MAG49-219 [uncultured Thermomicrobiales bacterium]